MSLFPRGGCGYMLPLGLRWPGAISTQYLCQNFSINRNISSNPCSHLKEIYPRGNDPRDLAVDKIEAHMVPFQTSRNALFPPQLDLLKQRVLGCWVLFLDAATRRWSGWDPAWRKARVHKGSQKGYEQGLYLRAADTQTSYWASCNLHCLILKWESTKHGVLWKQCK